MIYIWWLQFIICAGLIFYLGEKLALYGEEIAGRLKISTALVGFLFLAIITSLPEVFTGIGAVTIADVPDFSVGDAFGSMFFNLLIIGLLEFQQSRKTKIPILVNVEKNHILTILFTNILLIICAVFIFLRGRFNINFSFLNVGYESFVLIALYIYGTQKIFTSQGNIAFEPQKDSSTPNKGISLWINFALAGLIIVASGFWLAKAGEKIVALTGWNTTLFGTVFLAIATSLPEIFVSYAALKLGLRGGRAAAGINMAVGNVLGSNFFDTMIIPICDIFYRKKTLLSEISVFNNLTVFLVITFGSLIAFGIVAKNKKFLWRFGIEISIMLILAAAAGVFFIFIR